MERSAAIYARISEDREGAGLGIKRQTEDCRALAEARGYEVYEVFADNDISAYSGKVRPGYRRLLETMAGGSIGVVLTWHTDRLHRSPLELEEYITVSDKSGVTTVTVQAGALDLSTANGRMTARIHGAVSRQESEHKSERIKRKAKELALAGKYLGGRVPFGWRVIDGTPELDEVAALVVREAHSHVLAGYSMGSFVARLNDRQVTTSTGREWSYATLRQMLLRPRNAGLADYEGEVVGVSEFPAIVERHIWEATCAMLNDPARRRSQTNKIKHLLSGIVLCECLQPMKSGQTTDRNGNRLNIYRCTVGGGGHVNKRMSYVDDHLRRQILFILTYAENKAASAPPDPALMERLRTDESAHRENLNQAARLFADGAIDGEQLAVMSRSINAKLTILKTQLAEMEQASAISERADLPRDVDWSDTNAAAEWDALPLERKRAWIRGNLIVILHRHSRGSARVFDPGTVQIVVKSGLDTRATPAMVGQWKAEHATWEEPTPYGFMLQPQAASGATGP